MQDHYHILSIETSCDDTGISIIRKTNEGVSKVSSALASQDEVHQKWGGVYPSEAKREHQKNLIPVLKKALKEANLLEEGSLSEPVELESIFQKETVLLDDIRDFFKKYKIKNINAIAVTVGPGLEPCLWVGINFAKALSLYLNLPIIPVNHIKAHILFFLLDNKDIDFPAVALVVSGGHTELILVNSLFSYDLIGRTRDDAAGECFDKTARILGLGYPGGPIISEKSKEFGNREKRFNISLPRPMMHTKDFDFSFSGLKTAVLYDFKSRDEETKKSEDYILEMSREIEEAITDVLVFKLKRASEEYGVQTIIIGGGVTANKRLQEKVRDIQRDFSQIDILIPPPSLSTDNADMIGAASTIEDKRESYKTIKAEANLKVY